jgi:DNA end-binding protein Ku
MRLIRAVWSGTISFGLVGIPVKLYPATESKDVRFHLIDRETGRRVRYKRVVEPEGDTAESDLPTDDHRGEPPGPEEVEPAQRARLSTGYEDGGAPRREAEVAYEDLVRGFEIDPGRWVTLEPEEIERARPTRSRTIDIEDFVQLDDIDPVHFEKTYHVAPAPESGADKPYVLLLRAMQRAGRVGIGRFVLRTKPHLVAIRPMGAILGLETLYFGDEIRDAAPLVRRLDGVQISDRELTIAEKLIDVLATEWDPSSYSDAYREELLRLIAEKTPVARPEPESPEEGPAHVELLMEALKASVEAAKDKRRTRGRRAG